MLEADVKTTSGREISAAQFRASKDFSGKSDEQIARELKVNARGINLSDPDKKDLSHYKQEMVELEAKYELTLRQLPSEQGKHAAIAFAVWLFPSLLVLVLGYAFAWVVGGFKRA